MANLEPLKQKCQPVPHVLEAGDARVQPFNLKVSNSRFAAAVGSDVSKNAAWQRTKSVNRTYTNMKHNIQVVSGQQTYTARSGDNLSKVSKYFYDDANGCLDIAKPTVLPIPTKSWAEADHTSINGLGGASRSERRAGSSKGESQWV